MKVAITGHRPDKLGGYDKNSSAVAKALDSELAYVVQHHGQITSLLVGMALGVDQLACRVALDRGIHVTACIPCPDYPNHWPVVSQQEYMELVQRIEAAGGDFILVSDEPYSPRLLQLRNMYMVDNSDVVMAVWNGTKGGTANCVQYALTRQRPIINIWERIPWEGGAPCAA